MTTTFCWWTGGNGGQCKFTQLITLSIEFVFALCTGHFKWELDAHSLSIQAASKEGDTYMYLRCTQLQGWAYDIRTRLASFLGLPVFAVYKNGGGRLCSFYDINDVDVWLGKQRWRIPNRKDLCYAHVFILNNEPQVLTLRMFGTQVLGCNYKLRESLKLILSVRTSFPFRVSW